MRPFLTFIWEKHRLLTLALGAALVAFTFFLGSFAVDAVYFANPANQHRQLELWMSPRYVGQSWDLPKPVIGEIMQIDLDTRPHDGPRTLADIIERTGLSLEDLQARVEAADRIQRLRQGR